jgi:hypothetical protein
MRVLCVKNEVRPEDVRQQFVILHLELPEATAGQVKPPAHFND